MDYSASVNETVSVGDCIGVSVGRNVSIMESVSVSDELTTSLGRNWLMWIQLNAWWINFVIKGIEWTKDWFMQQIPIWADFWNNLFSGTN